MELLLDLIVRTIVLNEKTDSEQNVTELKSVVVLVTETFI